MSLSPPSVGRRSVTLSRCILTLGFMTTVLLPRGVQANPSVTGAWSPTYDLGFFAVHLVQIPGDGNPYHSRILTWDEAVPRVVLKKEVA
jgi:hypothetical protein